MSKLPTMLVHDLQVRDAGGPAPRVVSAADGAAEAS